MTQANYWHALTLTHETGLARRHHYALTMGSEAERLRNSLCASVPYFLGLELHPDRDLSGWGTVVLYPPDAPLPKEIADVLENFDTVVSASGTQIVEMQNSDDPRAEDFSPTARREFATHLLAVGDPRGLLIRQKVWEAANDGWRLSKVARNLAANDGLPASRYEELRKSLGKVPPPFDGRRVKRRRKRYFDALDREEEWVSFLQIGDFLGLPSNRQIRSDPVRSGH